MKKSLCNLAAVMLFATGVTGAMAQERTEAPRIRIYDPGELSLDRYTVVKRIWAGTWRASFQVPLHDNQAGAVEALTVQAAGAGADGVTNVHCLRDADWDGRYFCYGLAIKRK